VAWADLPAGFREIIERVCTPAERDVMTRIADGDGYRKIARARGCAIGTVQNLRNRAEAKIEREILARTDGK
jgi:DNA-binding CsgD family transcriptional regulator